MKKRVIVLFLVFITLAASAQKAKVLNYQVVDYRTLHFGFTIGLNTFDFNFKRRAKGDSLFADVSRIEPGFNVNIVSELRLNQDFALRFLPGLVFGQRSIYFIRQPNDKSSLGRIDTESNFLDFPVILKYKAKRLNNFRPYLIAGTSFRYDMAARKNPKLDGYPIWVRLKPFDVYYELGYGMDFYLTYFKFSTELKLSLGARDILDSDLHMAGVNGLTSKLILINFHFE